MRVVGGFGGGAGGGGGKMRFFGWGRNRMMEFRYLRLKRVRYAFFVHRL